MTPKFHYAYHPAGLAFTEQEWITDASPHFISPNELGEWGIVAILAQVWDEHLRLGTIIPADDPGPTMERGVGLKPGTTLGCPACHHVHTVDKHRWIMPYAHHYASFSPYDGDWKI